MKMKIDSKDFRVRPGEKVKLREWPSIVQALLQVEEAVSKTDRRTRCGVEFAAMSSLRVQPLCVAADFSGDGRGRQGRRHPARHVRGQSARLPGFQFQTAERRRDRKSTRLNSSHLG